MRHRVPALANQLHQCRHTVPIPTRRLRPQVVDHRTPRAMRASAPRRGRRLFIRVKLKKYRRARRPCQALFAGHGRHPRGRRLLGRVLPALGTGAVGRRSVALHVVRKARAGRDEPAHDHVLLEPAQLVDLAGNRRLGQHPGRLLERRGRDEALGRERGSGDPQQDRPAGRRAPPGLDDLAVLLLEDEPGRPARRRRTRSCRRRRP